MLISEYTGGGFGSKIPGAQTMAIPALMSKKLNGRPVMMRISREEETYIGRTRPGYQGWIKMGFKKDGRVTAIDTLHRRSQRARIAARAITSTTANLASLLYQAPNMRFRGISVATNTPPGVSQRAPGGLQASVMFEPLVRRGREASSASIRSRFARSTRPKGRRSSASYRRTRRRDVRAHKLTSCFVKEALDKGAELFNWEERKSEQRPAHRQQGDAASAVGIGAYTAGSIGVDGLCVIKPDGKLYIHQGIGNLGTHSVMRHGARHRRSGRTCRGRTAKSIWGNTSKGVPWSSIQAGSQTTYAHTRANYAAGMDLQEASCRSLRGEDLGRLAGRLRRRREGVFRKGGGRAMTWAQGGRSARSSSVASYDGHETAEGNQRA